MMEVVNLFCDICPLPHMQHLGDSTQLLQDIASGKHPFRKVIFSQMNPLPSISTSSPVIQELSVSCTATYDHGWE